MKAYLLLEDGSVFEGKSMGCEGIAFGEVAFDTVMGSFQEVVTDKTNYGMLLAMTYPLVGNYGYNDNDSLSDGGYIGGLIVRECCEMPSNFMCKGTYGDFLKEKGVVGIQGIDTRQLTRKIRDMGNLNGVIYSQGELTEEKKAELLAQTKAFAIRGALKAVDVDKTYVAAEGTKHVGIINLGKEKPLVAMAKEMGCKATVISPFTSAEEVKAMGLDGVLVSSGCGSYEENKEVADMICALSESGLPMLAIGKGFELLAAAKGATIVKLKYGHHGANHPVKNLKTGRTYITSHCHSYTVDKDSVKNGEITYLSLNDQSVEGIRYSDKVEAVAFEPEQLKGDHTTRYILDNFFAQL